VERREKPPVIPAKLIIMLSFVRSEEGDIVPFFGEAIEMRDEAQAIRAAQAIASQRAGVIVRTRTADLVNGDFGDPVTLFKHGQVPDME